MTPYERICTELLEAPRAWLVTGAAGFIGSNLLEKLLSLEQTVIGLDNFSTGHQHNLDDVRAAVSGEQWRRFLLIKGDIRDPDTCRRACEGINFVLHEAALGSVPRSLHDPVATNATNVTGFLNMLVAARDAGVESFTYAASSSTYGDHPALPKVEDAIGKPLSPYAVTKLVNEIYAEIFWRCYGFSSIGLRYFNVFGPRQDPDGAYAAVIPKWTAALLKNEVVRINGDGETSRDFCYVDNVVQANILAATSRDEKALNQIYNIALGERTTLNDLYNQLKGALSFHNVLVQSHKPQFAEFRAGDVKHSQASIDKARTLLGYRPQYAFSEGLPLAVSWYVNHSDVMSVGAST